MSTCMCWALLVGLPCIILLTGHVTGEDTEPWNCVRVVGRPIYGGAGEGGAEPGGR